MQEHAETVKGMAKSARSGPEAPAAAAPRQGSEAKAEPVTTWESRAIGPPLPRPAGGLRDPPEAATDDTTCVPESDDTTSVPESDDTVRIVEEPATAAASRGEAGLEGDRSLRELFWGED